MALSLSLSLFVSSFQNANRSRCVREKGGERERRGGPSVIFETTLSRQLYLTIHEYNLFVYTLFVNDIYIEVTKCHISMYINICLVGHQDGRDTGLPLVLVSTGTSLSAGT